VEELLSWAQCFDKADIGTKHLIVSRLIERVDVRTGYLPAKQILFMRRKETP
jgi:hypothetical protein